MTGQLTKAPELQVSQWFNTKQAITLNALTGKVVVIEAFQMLCPGCVSHGLPLAQKIHNTFPSDQVTVIGLHTVFEHHAAMTPVSLEAFLFEYNIQFPVAIDQPGAANIPMTMGTYNLRGTPSLVLIDGAGNLRANHFGQVSELLIGAEIAALIGESDVATNNTSPDDTGQRSCRDDGCLL